MQEEYCSNRLEKSPKSSLYIPWPLQFLKHVAPSGLCHQIRELELNKLGILLVQNPEKFKFNPDLWGKE